MRSWSTGLSGLLLVAILATPAWAQRRPHKVYISADMEGVVGVVTSDHLGPTGWEYQNARRWLTSEVNAAIRAAKAKGQGIKAIARDLGVGVSVVQRVVAAC